jgi:hypothetical protein
MLQRRPSPKRRIHSRPRPPRLLQPRADSAAMLGTSVQSIVALEKGGKLTAVRLTSRKVYNLVDEVRRLAGVQP